LPITAWGRAAGRGRKGEKLDGKRKKASHQTALVPDTTAHDNPSSGDGKKKPSMAGGYAGQAWGPPPRLEGKMKGTV